MALSAICEIWTQLTQEAGGVSLFAGLDSPLEHGTGSWDWIIRLECGTGTLLERVSNKCNCLRAITEAINSNCLRASCTLVQFPISTL